MTQAKKKPIAARATQRTVEVVDPRWVLKAFALVVLVAFSCGYLTLCYLFSQGQWQLVLQPSHTVSATPASQGLAFQDVHFGVDVSGKPQLTGWWIPSDSAADPTVLMLHGGSGSMGDSVARIRSLHDARLNVFIFDYAGFGYSAGQHPTEALMEANATAALVYLTDTRGIKPGAILVYGEGLGASLAVRLCAQQPALEALLLESADGDFLSRVRRDPRAQIVPVGWLFHDTFPLADALHTLKTPKLLVSYSDGSAPVDASRAADPKFTVEIPHHSDTADFQQALRRFLDSYVVRAPGMLQPGSAQ